MAALNKNGHLAGVPGEPQSQAQAAAPGAPTVETGVSVTSPNLQLNTLVQLIEKCHAELMARVDALETSTKATGDSVDKLITRLVKQPMIDGSEYEALAARNKKLEVRITELEEEQRKHRDSERKCEEAAKKFSKRFGQRPDHLKWSDRQLHDCQPMELPVIPARMVPEHTGVKKLAPESMEEGAHGE